MRRTPELACPTLLVLWLLLAGLLLASSFGLLRAAPWSLLALRASAWAGLALGVCLHAPVEETRFGVFRM